jgi:type IV pilus assembly protein PilQ
MVLIEARVIEANLTFQRELGVRWGFLAGGNKSDGTIGKATARGGLIDNNLVNLPAVPKVGTAGIIEFLFSRGTIKELDIAISAHENQGDLKIISTPKIATLDNTKASILQGLSIPYPQQEGEGKVTTVFKDALLKLVVTPHVTNDGYIRMSITVNKDAPDTTVPGVDGLPSIDKKEAITEVLIKDGGVVAIGGIYTIEKTEGNEGIPLFGKIPLLGWLFKREAKEDKRKDLLIFISPKILKEEI